MADVPVPDPPDLSNRGAPREFGDEEGFGPEAEARREELEDVLREGAWREAFDEWAEYTDLSDAELETVRDLGLFQELDFYWDASDDRLRSDAPRVPDDADLPDAGARATIETALDELGRTVAELIEDAYLEWGEEEPSDYVWDEETFGEGIDRE